MSLDSPDVVERLRTWTALGTTVPFIRDLNDAIAEIERLRAEVDAPLETRACLWLMSHRNAHVGPGCGCTCALPVGHRGAHQCSIDVIGTKVVA